MKFDFKLSIESINLILFAESTFHLATCVCQSVSDSEFQSTARRACRAGQCQECLSASGEIETLLIALRLAL